MFLLFRTPAEIVVAPSATGRPILGALPSTPTDIAFEDVAHPGTPGESAALAGHRHGAPYNPVTAHVLASDPHPVYVLKTGGSPPGELGGTWDYITVDATHSGSSHSDIPTQTGGLNFNMAGYAFIELDGSSGSRLDFHGPTSVDYGARLIVNADSGGTGDASLTFHGNELYFQTGSINMANHAIVSPLDPTAGTHVGDRDFNDGRYVNRSNEWVATPADTAVNSTSDVTIVTTDITSVAAGDQLIVDAWFTILNDSTAARSYTCTIDFDGAFDVKLTTGALNNAAAGAHPIHMSAVCDIRSSSLAYMMSIIDLNLLTVLGSGADSTAAATTLETRGWGTTAGNLTGTTTVALKVNSTNVTATQTLRLHSMTIRRVTPG